MEVKDHLPLSELRRLERVEKDADRAKRLRIVILGIEGWTAPAVAMAVGLKLLGYRSFLLEQVAAGRWSMTTANERLASVKSLMRWLWRSEAVGP